MPSPRERLASCVLLLRELSEPWRPLSTFLLLSSLVSSDVSEVREKESTLSSGLSSTVAASMLALSADRSSTLERLRLLSKKLARKVSMEQIGEPQLTIVW